MRRVVLFLLALILLSGCASIYEHEYYEKTPHEEEGAEEGDPGEATVSGFASLKQAILRMIRGGLDEGSLRAVGYQGDFVRDLDIALKEVRNLEPLGAYAVDYMTSELSPVPAQNTATVYINYRRSASLDDLRQVSGAAELRSVFGETLDTYRKSLVVEMSYYDPTEHNIAEMLDREYYDNPARALGLPGYTLSLYPTDAEDFLPRILEITFEYWDTAEILDEQKRTCEERITALLASKPEDLSPAEAALWLHDTLAERIVFDEVTVMNDFNTGIPKKVPSYTLYGALAGGFAVSEGYALAYKLGLDLLGIECRIVKGRRNNYDHKWNLVRLEGDWYHVDVAANDSSPVLSHEWFLLSDDDMGMYSWGDAYPEALPAPLRYETVAGIEPPDGGEEFPPAKTMDAENTEAEAEGGAE